MSPSRLIAVVLLAGTTVAGCVHVQRPADCYDPLNPAATDMRYCPIDYREDHGGDGVAVAGGGGGRVDNANGGAAIGGGRQ